MQFLFLLSSTHYHAVINHIMAIGSTLSLGGLCKLSMETMAPYTCKILFINLHSGMVLKLKKICRYGTCGSGLPAVTSVSVSLAAGGSLHCSSWRGGHNGGADRDTHLVKAQPAHKASGLAQR